MQTRAEWMREIESLLTGTKHERFARAKTLNIAATAVILGIDKDRVSPLMKSAGFTGGKIGNSRLYDKSSVFEAAKLAGILS